jgi:catalase
LLAVQVALHKAGVVTVVVAPRQGQIETTDGEAIEATASFENSPPMLFDAVLLPDGEVGVRSLLRHAQAIDFVDEQFRQGKTLLSLGASKVLLDHACADALLASGAADPCVLLAEAAEAEAAHAAFITAIGKRRHAACEAEPSRV